MKWNTHKSLGNSVLTNICSDGRLTIQKDGSGFKRTASSGNRNRSEVTLAPVLNGKQKLKGMTSDLGY